MKTIIKTHLIVLLSSILLLTSCRSEETEFIDTTPEDVVQINSEIANLIQRTAANDG
jgi:uncharacterized lipoprotein YajG